MRLHPQRLLLKKRVNARWPAWLLLAGLFQVILPTWSLAFEGGKNAENERLAVVYIQSHFDEEIPSISCSGILIDEETAITASHCLYQREGRMRAKDALVCIGRQKPFNQPGEACFTTTNYTIYPTGPKQLSGLAYIRLPEPIPLNFLDIEVVSPIRRAQEFALLKRLLDRPNLKLEVKILSFGSRSLAYPTNAKKNQIVAKNLTWDPLTHHWQVEKYGTGMLANDAGAALLVKLSGKWYLSGVLAYSNPPFLYVAEPFFDPCAPPQPPPPQPSLLLTSIYKFVSVNLGQCRSERCRQPYHSYSNDLLARAVQRKDVRLLYRHAWKDAEPPFKGPRLSLLRAAANLGYPEAMYDLAILYREGRFLPRNQKMAETWMRKAVRNGSVQALYESARTMQGGARLDVLLKAARKGFAPAQREIAKSYIEQPALYYRWLMRAARQGDPEAQYLLAQTFLDGYGVRPDNHIARQWMKYAASKGQRDAIAYLDKHPDTVLDIYDLGLANE